MIFNSKQLEELENMHDSSGSLDEDSDDRENNSDGDAAMEWRRQLIEEAAENVKRAASRPVEPTIIYDAGSLLFDRDTRRFARVGASIPGFLKLLFLNGGERELGVLDLATYLTDNAAEKKVSEMALQLGMSNADVLAELDSLGLEPVFEEGKTREEVEAAVVQPPEPAPKKAKKAASKKKPAAEKKAPAKKKAAEPKAEEAKKPAAKKAPAKKKATRRRVSKEGIDGNNPIDDPNGYIKAHYKEMSNRELARETGLSEHTIRRKLGEWGLKRDRKKKAPAKKKKK